MKRNQVSSHTEFDRTPLIFKTVASLYPSLKILSFGCSTGEEIRTLNEKYFPNCVIHGIDIDKDIIADNIKQNSNPLISYFAKYEDLHKNYDVIFCMSVLCRWPNNQEEYEFDAFEDTLYELDRRLNVGGHLVIYNAQFLFEETVLAHRYIPLRTNDVFSGFVTKFHRNNEKAIDDYYPVIFRKIADEKNTAAKFGVIWASTINIGDDIQAIAARNFLRKKGYYNMAFVNRENLSNYCGEPISLIMNGWFMHDITKFPPPESITPIFISFHCAGEILIATHREYFKKHEPIGCRDFATVNTFKKYGIDAYFTGCMTLYFRPSYCKGDKSYIVDVNECSYIPKVAIDTTQLSGFHKVSHDLTAIEDRNNQLARLSKADALLKLYASARLVITSRLHCALPCRAFRTSVKFVHSNLNDPRFSGLEHVLAGAPNLNDAKETISEEHLKAIVDIFDRIQI